MGSALQGILTQLPLFVEHHESSWNHICVTDTDTTAPLPAYTSLGIYPYFLLQFDAGFFLLHECWVLDSIWTRVFFASFLVTFSFCIGLYAQDRNDIVQHSLWI